MILGIVRDDAGEFSRDDQIGRTCDDFSKRSALVEVATSEGGTLGVSITARATRTD